MLQIRITQNWAKVGINQIPAQIRIDNRLAELEISQELGEFEIATKPPQVRIDLKEAFGDLGMRKPDQVARDYKAESWKAFGQDLSRLVAEGDRMARIELGGRAIVEIARENAVDHKEINVAAVPKQRPKITASIEDVHLRYRLGGARTDLEPRPVGIDYIPGVVETYLLEEPWIKIDVVGSNVDLVI